MKHKGELLTERQKKAYSVFLRKLGPIDAHAFFVKNERPGYFMSLENILKKISVTSTRPQDWLEGVLVEGEQVLFSDLSPEIQKRISHALDELGVESESPKHLEEKCRVCGEICFQISKILIANRRAELAPT